MPFDGIPGVWETAIVLEPSTSPLWPGDPQSPGPYRVASRLGSGGMPGERIAGTLVFDLPNNERPERLVLHDSLLSGGVTIRVAKG